MECGTWVCKVLATWIKPKHRFKKYGIRYGTLSMTGYPEMLMKTKEENTGSRVAKCRGTVARRREPLPGERRLRVRGSRWHTAATGYPQTLLKIKDRAKDY